ncbi:MAG: metallophosphoesterase, partial [Burkholderiaceae bacterium]
MHRSNVIQAGFLIATVVIAGLLFQCASQLQQTLQKQTADNIRVAYVVLGENGAPMARFVTTEALCPLIRFDQYDVRMDVRAAPQSLPLRPTRSAPTDSKPSVFPVLTCEKKIPPNTRSAMIGTLSLPLPAADIKRIVIIGDTGCRLKKSDAAYQACNDGNLYPFAKVATAAAHWKPDLVVHVGDFHYRENACAIGNAGCAGSPWGYGWDAWQADFFKPAAALLKAAPWVMVRGNHESCARAGQGWWRLLDPRP